MKKLKPLRLLGSYVALAVMALIIGYVSFSLFIGPPKIGIVKISGVGLDQATADKVGRLLEYAKDDRNIKAVVIELDCPGGEASATEEIYLSLLELREERPLVVSIDGVALSGGYYIAVASDFIYAKPTSILGSIGVWMRLPGPERPEEDIIPSGPAKSTGGARKKATTWLQTVTEGFLQAVITQRGNNLRLSKEELSQAEAYIGVEALRYGLIDKIGSRSAAVEKAASLAGLRNYQEVDINKELDLLLPYTRFSFYGLSPDTENLSSARSVYPQYYYLDIRARK